MEVSLTYDVAPTSRQRPESLLQSPRVESSSVNYETSVATLQHNEMQRYSTPEEITAWFMPKEGDTPIESLRDTYSQARELYLSQSSARKKDTPPWLAQADSIESVLEAVRSAETKYTAKQDGRSKLHSTVGSWWTKAVSKIVNFQDIVDTFVSSNPEYAALVWGSMKFLFMVTLNHRELSSNVAEAFASVGDALPEANFLVQQLYPVAQMQRTLQVLYKHIIDFCIRALKWYQRATRGIVQQAVVAVKNPWPLEFQDVARKIRETMARLREQSAIAHQAETRHIANMLSEIRIEIRELRRLKDEISAPAAYNAFRPTYNTHFSIPPNLPAPNRLPFNYERVLACIAPTAFDPIQVLALGAAVRDRRKSRGEGTAAGPIWVSTQLRDWISDARPALVEVAGSRILVAHSRDFALDMIQLAQSTKLPVTWHLCSLRSTRSGHTITTRDILRSIVRQVMTSYHELLIDSEVDETTVAACKTEEHWFRLLILIISFIPRIVFVIDTHDSPGQAMDMIREFWNAAKSLGTDSVIKMLVLTYSATGPPMSNLLEGDEVAYYKANLSQDRKPGTSRILQSRGIKAGRKVSSRTESNIERFRPLMLKQLPSGAEQGIENRIPI
ncbi:hypothetical protein GQ53DRAFT_837507 [Thozetella sp. PMI_491]|nr:hypothetical protein GQ53DRAFT_837507 [Thozetella sp. PMI_491]